MAERKLTRAMFAEWGKQSSGPAKMKKKPREYFVEIGRKGGKSRAKKLSTPLPTEPLA